MKRLACFVLLASGCATTGGVAPARQAQHFTGYPYDVRDEGNRVSGQVCGVNVDYTVEQRGAKTVLSGFDGAHQPVYLEVRADGDGRRITGSLSQRAGVGEVDLRVTPSDIAGRAGLRHFELHANGDQFDGVMTALDMQGHGDATVEGRSELGALPLADVGAILPTLLNCEGRLGHYLFQNPLLVRLGGPAGYEPRAANAVR
jgi:hypothetical protein